MGQLDWVTYDSQVQFAVTACIINQTWASTCLAKHLIHFDVFEPHILDHKSAIVGHKLASHNCRMNKLFAFTCFGSSEVHAIDFKPGPACTNRPQSPQRCSHYLKLHGTGCTLEQRLLQAAGQGATCDNCCCKCVYVYVYVCSKGKGKGPSNQGLQLPDVDTVLPLRVALQGLPDQLPAAVKAVYCHWCTKRHGSERPLLQRLWYEPPWHRLTVAGDISITHSLYFTCQQIGNHMLLIYHYSDSSFFQPCFVTCLIRTQSHQRVMHHSSLILPL